MKLRLLTFLSLLTILACTKVDKSLLVGKWNVDIVEGVGEKDMENMSGISFQFLPNNRYSFQSTLNITEAGRYSIVGDLLNTTDTTVTNPKEKSVKITKLTPDSLYFLMNVGGEKQNLKFVRAGN